MVPAVAASECFIAALPANEMERQQAVDDSGLIGTPPEERFDRLTRLAKRLFDADMAFISLSDHQRQWFKSRVGFEAEEAPRDTSFCSHILLSDEPLIVPDATQDPRFCNNPFVLGEPGVRFYAGIPLKFQGQILGSFCVAGCQPKALDEEDVAALHDLAKLAEAEVESVQNAIVDELTGLLNLRGLRQMGQQIYKHCRRQFAPLTCLFFDLNGFKAINDQLSHKVGDEALQGFANTLRSVNREGDSVVARKGGDEFVVLMGNADRSAADLMLSRFDKALAKYNANQAFYQLRYSVGIIERQPTQTLEDLISTADNAMYEDKRQRKAQRKAS